MKITDIFFDLDRTLWDFDRNSHKTLMYIYQEFNLNIKGVIDIDAFIASYTVHNEKLWALYRENRISKELLRSERFHLTLSDFGIDDNNLSVQLGDAYVSRCPLQTLLCSYSIEILEYLNKRYNLHIITNGFEEVQHIKLEASGLSSFFLNIITSEKVDAKKPDPMIFEYALKLAKVKAENSIMIGDDLPVDIIGAKSVGIHQIYFNPNKKDHNEIIDYEVSSLIEIKEIL